MKLKHILFSSLFLSTAFVACTNEDLVEMDAPNVQGKAISLGENLTIAGGFGQADTRAIYGEEAGAIKSLWEPEDKVGGAWYAALTDTGNAGNQYKHDGFFFSTKVFASNHPYVRVDKNGNVASAEFVTNTNSFAGKYALYFPYDAEVAAAAASIPVTIETAQTMDVTKPLAHISKSENYFAYTNVEFVEGGAQAENFEMKPVPVLYRLTFKAADNADMRALVGKDISMVIVECDRGLNYFYSEGELTVGAKTTGRSAYEQAEAVYSGKVGKETNLITLTVEGNQGNADYQISAVGSNGGMKKPFYMVALPMDDSVTELTFTVVTTDGKVFKKTVSDLGATDKEAIKNAITSEGGSFNANITLDTVGESNGAVYTKQQFENAWEEAVASGKAEKIELGAPLSLDALTLSETGADITIKGKPLTVATLNAEDGALKVENLVAGNVTVGLYGSLSATITAKVTGATVVRGGVLSLNGVESMASIDAQRRSTVTITGAGTNKMITGAFTTAVQSEVVLKNIVVAGTSSIAGKVTVDDDGTVQFAGSTTVAAEGEVKGDATATLLKFTGSLTNNGTIDNTNITTLEFGALTNNKLIDAKANGIVFKGSTTNAGEIAIKASVSVTNKGTLTNRGKITGTGTLTNSKDKTLTLQATSEAPITNQNGATLNVKCADVPAVVGGAAAAPANLNVSNSGTINVELASDTKSVTFTSLIDAGTAKMNIVKGTAIVPGAMTSTEGAEIYVDENGVLKFATTSVGTLNGLIIISKTSSSAVKDAAISQEYAAYYDERAATDAKTLIVRETTSLKFATDKNYILRANVNMTGDCTMIAGQKIKVEGEVLIQGNYTTTPANAVEVLKVNATGSIIVPTGSLLKIGYDAELNLNSVTLTDAARIVTVNGGSIQPS